MTETEIATKADNLTAEKAALEPHFWAVCDSKDWKKPVNAFCRRDDMGQVSRAITFFTSTLASFSETVPRCEDWVRVKADGYRKGPAGDH